MHDEEVVFKRKTDFPDIAVLDEPAQRFGKSDFVEAEKVAVGVGGYLHEGHGITGPFAESGLCFGVEPDDCLPFKLGYGFVGGLDGIDHGDSAVESDGVEVVDSFFGYGYVVGLGLFRIHGTKVGNNSQMSQVINENHIRTSSSRARRDRRRRGNGGSGIGR